MAEVMLPDKVTARLRALGQAEVAAQLALNQAHQLLIETTAAVLEALGCDIDDGTYSVDNGTGAVTHTPKLEPEAPAPSEVAGDPLPFVAAPT